MNGEKAAPFENVKDQIGFCGIWCGSCVAGNGTLRELTKRYAETIKAYGLKEWAPDNFDYEEFSKGLASIQDMPLCPGCLKGGGRDNCEIRACASEKNLNDCSECPDIGSCEHAEILEKMRSGALDAGLSVKDTTSDKQELIEKWTAELRNTWPSSIIFMED